MKLISINTKNFKRLGTRTINLTSGLNAITGPNGFGKTTLIEAVLTCLYGTSQVRGAAASLKTRGTVDAWRVEVVFQLGKSFYKVSCSASTAEVLKSTITDFKTGECVAKGRSDSTATVSQLIGSADTFKFLHLIEQKEASSIAKTGGIRLQRQVEKQTGADVLLQVEEWCKTEFNRIDAIVNHRHAVVEHSADDLSEKKSELIGKLSVKMRERSDVDEFAHFVQYRDDSEAELAKARVELQEWQNKSAAISNAEVKIENAGNVVDMVKQQRDEIKLGSMSDPSLIADLTDKLEVVSRKIAEAEKVDAEIVKHERALQEFARKKATLQGTLDSLKDTADQEIPSTAAVKKTIADLEAKITASNGEMLAAYEKQDHHLRSVKSLKNDLATFEHQLHSTTCPTCQQKMPDITPEYIEKVEAKVIKAKLDIENEQGYADKAGNEAGELSKQVKSLQAKLQLGSRELSDLNNVRDSIKAARTKVADTQAKLNVLNATDLGSVPSRIDVRPLFTEREQINAEITAQRRADEEYNEALERINYLSGRISLAIEDRNGLVRELEALGELGSKPAVEFLEERCKEFREKAANYLSNRDRLNHEINGVQSELNSLETMISKIEEEQTELELLRKRRATVTELTKYVKSRRSAYLGTVWSAICREASGIARAITEGIVSESGQSTEIDNIAREGDSFVCTEGGHQVSIKELSGAQEDVAGISVKMAVSKVLNPGSGFLIMDEPTSAMSSIIGTRCVSVISSVNGQVVTVTHKEDEIRSAENVVELC